MLKPTVGNILLWRSVYLSKDKFYVDVVRVGLSKRIYHGNSIEKFSVKNTFPTIDVDSTLARDIRRFEYFSDEYVSQYPGKPDILGDIRYAPEPFERYPVMGN